MGKNESGEMGKSWEGRRERERLTELESLVVGDRGGEELVQQRLQLLPDALLRAGRRLERERREVNETRPLRPTQTPGPGSAKVRQKVTGDPLRITWRGFTAKTRGSGA